MAKYRIFARNVDKMTKAEWLNLRRQGLGGSDAAAVCGANPWRGPLSVYLSKIGAAPDTESNEAMMWGNVLEDPIAKEFSRRTQQKIKRCNMILQHAEHDFMLANIDRLTFDEEEGEWGVLEVKNVGEYRREDWADGAVPDYYAIQSAHYMAVTGLKYAWFAPLIGGNRLQPVKVMRNERLIASLIKIERDFWHLVETKTPPPLDDSVEATKVLKALYPQSQSTSVVIDPTTYAKFTAVRERIKTLEQEARGYENELRLAMGEAEAAYVPGCEKPVITWKGGTVKKFDEAAFKAENPELAMRYMKEVTTRRFLVK
jgi:putative phage-type endonuclease